MSDHVMRISVWASTRLRLASYDRGAVTTETAIITGVIAVAAAGLGVFIAETVIPGWRDDIPLAP